MGKGLENADINLEYHIVSAPRPKLGPPPLLQASVSPPRNQRAGTHSLAGEGVPIKTTGEKAQHSV
jgi:hypothetical protein